MLLSSSCVPALAQLLFLPWFPESPRYLLIDRGDELSCAKGNIQHLYFLFSRRVQWLYWASDSAFIFIHTAQLYHLVLFGSCFSSSELIWKKGLWSSGVCNGLWTKLYYPYSDVSSLIGAWSWLLLVESSLSGSSKLLLQRSTFALRRQIVTWDIFNHEDFKGTDAVYSLRPLVTILVWDPNHFWLYLP